MAAEVLAFAVIDDRIVLISLVGLLSFFFWTLHQFRSPEETNAEAAPSSFSGKDVRALASLTVVIAGLMASGYAPWRDEPGPAMSSSEAYATYRGSDPRAKHDTRATSDGGVRQTFNERVQRGLLMERRGFPAFAEADYRDAMSDGTITLGEAALPFMRLAKIAFEDERFDTALSYGQLAMVHLEDSTENTNIFARILIRHCRLADALDRLGRLSQHDDVTLELMAAASDPGVALACERDVTATVGHSASATSSATF